MSEQTRRSMKHPRLLILSNNCLSKQNSNGRTLMEMLVGYPSDQIAQFYIKAGSPDHSVCGHYYHLSDIDVLRAALGKQARVGEVREKTESDAVPRAGKRRVPRNTATMIIRNCIWNSARWRAPFLKWADDFSPECILLQVGDSTFMLQMALELSERFQVPLVLFNSENYYFKDEDYLGSSMTDRLLYILFIRNYRMWFRRLMQRAAHTVYLNEPLKELYDAAFHRPGSVIMTSSSVFGTGSGSQKASGPLRFSYLGNLGLNRHTALIEIANTLHGISSEYHLDVYGKCSAPEVQRELEACPGIRFHGFVEYSEVLRVMRESTLLFHAEAMDPATEKDLRYAFSSKIADSLAIGVCLVYYGPASIACADYLTDHACAEVITRREDLHDRLERLISDPELRQQYVERALLAADENHRAERNSRRMEAVILESTSG